MGCVGCRWRGSEIGSDNWKWYRGGNRNAIGAIYFAVIGDRGKITKQEFGTAKSLVGEVGRASAGGEPCNPIRATDLGTNVQLKIIEVHRNGQRCDASTGRHAQMPVVHLGQADMGSGMKLILK